MKNYLTYYVNFLPTTRITTQIRGGLADNMKMGG